MIRPPIFAAKPSIVTPPSGIMPRTFTNTAGSALPAVAFWSIRHPFGDGEVPSGHVVTAAFGGVAVPVHGSGITTYASGALKGADLLIDLSGITLAAGASANLVLTAAAGSWSSTTSRSDADWAAQVDTIEISSVTRTSGVALPLTYTAAFDAGITNRIVQTTSGPRGIKVLVFATLIGSLQAVGEYWVCEKADASLGPVRSHFYIENTQADLALPCRYDFTATWKRNGVVQRTRTGIQLHVGGVCNLGRPDGQADWTGTDPALDVGQSVDFLRATKQIPPIKTGLAYTGVAEWACSINTSTGLVTATGASFSIFGANSTGYPTAVDFRGTVLPSGSGFADGNIYWASFVSADTFFIYNNLVNATAAGSTGKLIPAGAGAGVVVRVSCGPMARGSLCRDLDATGGRPDLGLLTGWSIASLVSNTQAARRWARANAYGMASLGQSWRYSVTGKVPGLLPTAQLPAGMGTGIETAYARDGSCSTNIGAGTGTYTGGGGQWSKQFAPEPSHMPNPVFLVWLLEGGDYLRELLYFQGNSAVLIKSYLPQRNMQVNQTGTIYYGLVLTEDGVNKRVAAWGFRGLFCAAAAAPDGSDEQAYFLRLMKNNLDWFAADRTFWGTNYQTMGIFAFFAESYVITPTNRAFTVDSVFMGYFLGMAVGYASLLLGDSPTISTNLALFKTSYVNGFMAGIVNYCPYFVNGYEFGPEYTESGWIGTYDDLGEIPGSITAFAYATGAGGTITWSGTDPPFPLANNDKFMPLDFLAQNTSPATAPPGNLVVGRWYFVRDLNLGAKTFAIAATSGGVAITYSSAVTGSGGVWHDISCEASGVSAGIPSDNGGYVPYAIATFGQAFVAGAGAASGSAYTAALAKYTGDPAENVTSLNFAFQDTA